MRGLQSISESCNYGAPPVKNIDARLKSVGPLLLIIEGFADEEASNVSLADSTFLVHGD